jgi:DNA-binding NtrC family response regulator
MDGYGKRVLVVDDDEGVGSLTSMLLEHAGYNVLRVYDAIDALVELKRRHFDVVVSDYSMPILNGLELLERIHAHAPETPVILMSGLLPDIVAGDEGVQPFACLRKPYERNVFLKLVRSATHLPSRTDMPDVSAAAMQLSRSGQLRP